MKIERIKFDALTDSAYIYLRQGKVFRTEAEEGGVRMFDFDDKGRLLGVEVLHCSEAEARALSFAPGFVEKMEKKFADDLGRLEVSG